MEKKPPHLIFDENTLANATDSERIFMEAMKKSLDDNWYVFHSLRFTWGERRAKRDYEIDFLLFTPLYGFLVVEVKGGAIKCSNGSYMVDGRPCDPFRQASTNMYAFKDMLLERLKTSYMPFRYAYAVAFPFKSAKSIVIPQDQAKRLIDKNILYNPENWVVAHIREMPLPGIPEGAARFGADDILKVLAPESAADDDLAATIKFSSEKIKRNAINPKQFLAMFSAFRRLKICGCAGSGKTLLAVEKARQLGEMGKRTLILCYNTMIAAKIKRDFDGSLPVTVGAFYEYGAEKLGLKDKVAAHRNSPKTYAIIADFMKKNLPDVEEPYDAVIVDEAQDFDDDMWEIVGGLLKKDAFFYIFYDPEQNVFGRKMNLPDFGIPPVMLTVNCRNTRKIASELGKYSSYAIESASGMPEGGAVKTLAGDCRENLGKLLATLVGENKVQPDDIAVIGAHGIGNTSIGKDRVVNGYEIADGGKAGCVGYYTYMKFKGCDSKVVILLDVDEKDKRWSRAGLYTALSRATSQAFILKKG